MSWTFTTEPDVYGDAVQALLESDPVANTIALTVLDAIRRGQRWGAEPLTLGWFTEADGTVSGAVSMTPPFGMLLSVVPEPTVPELIEQLRARGTVVPTVHAAEPLARAFADGWTDSSELILGNRLFVLGQLQPPRPSPAGSSRRASEADIDLLLHWLADFMAEAESHAPVPSRDMTLFRVERGLFWFWLDPSGQPVSMAGRNVSTVGVSRVGPVYTPPEHRGHGYAAAVTAVCSQHALDTDANQVILFTDVANPTSNGIYQRLGYRPVLDRVVLKLN